MRLGHLTLLIALLAGLAALAGCRDKKSVHVIGSTSVQPFAELLAEEYEHVAPEISVEVQGGGSTAGIEALASGLADIGMVSRSLKPEEAEKYHPIVIARDGLTIIVHPSNRRINDLTIEQIRMLFTGQAGNWKDVGGDDSPVWLIMREEGSGTREAFMKLVMGKNRVSRRAIVQPSNGAVRELVKHNPGAIGYISIGLVDDEVKAVRVEGVEPTAEAVIAGRYPLVRPFLFVIHNRPVHTTTSPADDLRARLAELPEHVTRWVNYVLGEQGQDILSGEGLIRVDR